MKDENLSMVRGMALIKKAALGAIRERRDPLVSG